ncbi:hypothetical protein P3X46_034586 [Hevea brasiliensis]|uniref:Uncharacterized protein n=1 Tax=Hevea brasiliensis TaxID=3981 RepID=A0ABQ9K7P8_HEVBR|nr:hypothetical protein P3X46_034586 [Hevea brasiliensis]
MKTFPVMVRTFMGRFIAGIYAQRKTSYLETRVVETMQNGITSSKFFDSLSPKLLTTLVELMQLQQSTFIQDDTLAISKFAKEEKGRE